MNLITVVLSAVCLLFLGIIGSTLIGGIVGWIVGGVFPYVIDTLNHLFGMTLSNWEVGATLGFFGSFFRSSLSK